MEAREVAAKNSVDRATFEVTDQRQNDSISASSSGETLELFGVVRLSEVAFGCRVVRGVQRSTIATRAIRPTSVRRERMKPQCLTSAQRHVLPIHRISDLRRDTTSFVSVE